MSQIKDTFELVDRFSAPLGKYEKALNSLQTRLQATEWQQKKLAEAGDMEGAEALSKKAVRLAEQLELKQTEYDVAQKLAEETRQIAAAEAAAEEAARRLAGALDESERASNRLLHGFSRLVTMPFRAARGIAQMGANMRDTLRPADGFTRKIMRMVATLFTARKLMRYIRDGLGRATGDTAASLERAGNALKDTFARITVSALQRIAPALDRLVAKLESPAGQRFARGLERIAELVGGALAWAIDKISAGIEWIGNNFSTLLAIAAPILAFIIGKMLAFAAATILAHLPLLLIIAALAGVVAWLHKMGVTSEQIIGYVGGLIGVLAVTVWNVVADIWNAFAIVAEFIGNVFVDPVGAIKNLFYDMAIFVLDIIGSIGRGIDKIVNFFGGSSDIGGWADRAKQTVDSWGLKSEKAFTVARMDKKEYADGWEKGYAMGESLANSFSGSALDSAVAPAIKNIDENTGSIKKSVSAAEEDIASLVDIAQRRYINQINLTAQTPVINITGQNTGNTDADARRLADTIKQMLIEQSAAGSTAATAMP